VDEVDDDAEGAPRDRTSEAEIEIGNRALIDVPTLGLGLDDELAERAKRHQHELGCGLFAIALIVSWLSCLAAVFDA
jgi:hypothetical protein